MYIKKLPNGKYLAQVYLGVENGKRKDTSKTFTDPKDAKDWAKGMEGDRARGDVSPLLSKQSFEAYLKETWLPWYRAEIRKRGSSTYNMEGRLSKWIFRAQPGVPLLGRRKLKDLTALSFSNFYTALDGKMKPESIKHLHSVLHRALNYAVSQDLLKVNPASNAKLPSKPVAGPDEENDVVECLTLEQAKRFREAAKEDQHGPLWLLLLDTGVRPGEAFALQWRHVDFDKGRIMVRQSLTCTYTAAEREQAGGRSWRVKVTKTKRSVRSVPVPKATLEVLRHWKAQQAKQRIQLGGEWHDHGFVFTKHNGEPLGQNMDRAWTQVMRAADGGRGDLGKWGPGTRKPVHGAQAARTFRPDFSMYTCRHTFATLLYENGVSIEDIARLLGNTPGICAKHYVRREREPSTQGVDVLTRLFEPGLKLA